MTLFEQLKMIPKVDMHINLTSSISTNLAFDLSDDTNILDVEEIMREKNIMEYEEALKMPVKILKKSSNLVLAIDDLIDKLLKNNVLYSELFIDLPLYNVKIDEERLVELIINVIEKRDYHMNLVLVTSSKRSKEDNLKTIEIFEKYYNKGVNAIYFYKEKMANLSDYMYIFDRLNKNNYPYILNMNSKVTNNEYDVYTKAKRIIYLLPNIDEELINECHKNNIMLEFAPTRFYENNLLTSFKEYFLGELIKSNISLTITSYDMTTLNTDILNEWCILFNNYPLVLLDMIKIIQNNLKNANINDEIKEQLIKEFKDKSNSILEE